MNVAVPRKGLSSTTLNGVYSTVIAKKWWDVQVKWDDQSTDWVPFTSYQGVKYN